MSSKTVLFLLSCSVLMLVAALVGAMAGYLARRDGASYPCAVARGGAAFGTTLVVEAAVVAAMAAVVGLL